MHALLVNPFIYDFAAYDLWAKPRGLIEVGRTLTALGWGVEFIDCLYPDDPGMAAFATRHPAILPPKPKRFGQSSYFQEVVPKPPELGRFPRHLRRYGFHPDCLRQRLREIKHEPAFVGVTGILTYWWHGVRDTIAVVKEVFPGVPVVLGGIYPTLLEDHARQFSGADHVFSGPASEASFASFLAGLGFGKERHGETDSHPQAPAPSSKRVAFQPYAKPAYGITALSEGCFHRCSYCACWRLRPKWTRRETGDILAEIDLAASLGCRDIAFYDDDLLFDYDRLLRPVLGEIRARGYSLRFHTPNGLYLNRITADMAGEMKAAGFETLRFGFETASEELGHRIGRKIGTREFGQRVNLLLEAGFRHDQIGIYLLAGLPGQTPEMVAESIRFVAQCGLKARLCEFSPVPGTPEFDRAKGESLLDIEREPFYQNNSLLALRSRRFDFDTLNRLKIMVHTHP